MKNPPSAGYIIRRTVPARAGEAAMMKARSVGAALRRDASIVLRIVVATVFVGFATLAVAAAVYDILPIAY